MAKDFADAIKKLEREKARVSAMLADINLALESLMKVNASLNPSSTFVFNFDDSAKKDKVLPFSDYEVVVPSEYNTDLGYPELLIFALKRKNGAFAHDAAEYIYGLNENLNLQTLKNRFTDVASALGRAGKIGYKKIGKKYKYYLKDEDEDFIW